MQLIFQPMQCLEPGLEFLNHKYYVTKWFQENVFNIQKNMDVIMGLLFFRRGLVPNLQKVGVNEIATSFFGNKKSYDPPLPKHLTP